MGHKRQQQPENMEIYLADNLVVKFLILAHDHLELRGYGRVHLVLYSCSQVTRIFLRLNMKLYLFIPFLAFQFSTYVLPIQILL